jgi:pimeloyl-ACP methyl ester carboxylesterase
MSGSAGGRTILVCHDAWSAGWAWKKMHPLTRGAGHRLLTPSYTGLGERVHLASPSVDLETHVQDILNVITYEDLSDIILLGHSYGGMVATGVADRARDKIAQLVYLDAFVPQDGECLLDHLNAQERQRMRGLVQSGDGWRVPPNPTPPDTPPADLEWLTTRRVDMPIKCFETKLRLQHGEPALPRSYIYCTRAAPTDAFGPFAKRAKSEPGWRYFELDASHSPNVTAPDALMVLLAKVVAENV